MAQLGAPWPEVQDAYLRAWEFRPTRAEPLYAIAVRYREDQRYQLGYQFAKRAAEIPFPEQDKIFVRADIYAWRATDEQAVCASWIGKQAEAFTLCRRLLARPDVPDEERQRITGNRDVCVPTMIDAAVIVPRCAGAAPASPAHATAEVVVSLIAGPDRTAHRAHAELVSALLPRCVAGRALPGGRCRPVRPGPRDCCCERYGFLDFAHPGPDRAGPAPNSPTSAITSTDGFGCIWARAGGFLPPRTSSPASRRCSRPNPRCSRWASTSPTRSS